MKAGLVPGILLSIFALNTACNNGSSGKHDAFVEPKESEILADYSLADSECQSAPNKEIDLTKMTIDAWDSQQLTTPTVMLEGTRTVASLQSHAISDTTRADVYKRDCDYTMPEGHRCDGADGQQQGWTRDDGASGGPLRVCQNDHQYGRTTYEGVAMASIYFVQRANDNYRRLTAAEGAKDPEALRLSILPRFSDDYHHFPTDRGDGILETYITHNLAYFPDAHMIAVFPETPKEAQAAYGFFWESEFVLGHEYGHHIDFTRHGQVLQSVGLRWQPLTHSYIDVEAQFQGLTSSARGQMAGALAEGFADLMGFYLGGGSSHTLIGLADIGSDRDVANPVFPSSKNKDAKILTPEHLKVFFGAVDDDLKAPGPHYSDIHTVGAIIAHAVDESFAELTGRNPALVDDAAAAADQRYKLTLAFMDAVVAEVAKLSADDAGEKVLAPVGIALEKAAADYLGGLSLTGDGATAARQAICKIARTQIPVMATVPFANGDGC